MMRIAFVVGAISLLIWLAPPVAWVAFVAGALVYDIYMGMERQDTTEIKHK